MKSFVVILALVAALLPVSHAAASEITSADAFQAAVRTQVQALNLVPLVSDKSEQVTTLLQLADGVESLTAVGEGLVLSKTINPSQLDELSACKEFIVLKLAEQNAPAAH